MWLCILSAAITPTARADDPSTPDRPAAPPRRLAATPEAELPFDSPRAVEVMGARAISDQHRSTVAEALLESEGAQAAWSAPSVSTVNVRGLGTPRVLVLQNGVRLTPGWSGPIATPLGDLDPFLVDQLEVVRGPASVLWGSDAMGGVINVVTQRPRFDPRRAWDIGADALLRFDSAASGLIGHAAAAGHLRRLGLRAGFTARRLDDLLGGRDTGRQRYTSYWQANADVAARLDLGPAGLVDLDYTRGERHDAYFPSTAGDAAFSRVRDHARDVVALNYAGKFPRVFLHGVELTLSAQSLRTLREGFRPEANRIDRERDETTTVSARAVLRTHVPYNRLSYGAEVAHDWISSTAEQELITEPTRIALGRGRYLDGSRFTQWGIFANDRVNIGSKLAFDLGGRVAGWRVDVPADPLSRLDAINTTRWTATGSLHARYAVGDGLNLVAGVSQGYRAPDVHDHTALGCTATTYEIPNSALRAERNLTAETGLKLDLFGVLEGSVFYFFTYLTDAILQSSASLPTASGGSTSTFYCGTKADGTPLLVPVTQRANAQHATLHGVETSLRVRLGARWSLGGWAAWTHGNASLDLPGNFDEPLSSVPPLRGLGGVRHEDPRGRWFAELVVRWAARQARVSSADRGNLAICPAGPSPCDGTPPYAVFAMRGAASVNRHLRLTLALENLTHESYRTHGSAIASPGFSAIVGLEGRAP